jgi:hypothetical protein
MSKKKTVKAGNRVVLFPEQVLVAEAIHSLESWINGADMVTDDIVLAIRASGVDSIDATNICEVMMAIALAAAKIASPKKPFDFLRESVEEFAVGEKMQKVAKKAKQAKR